MKFMKIGTKPDTFYTEEAIRTVNSDIASDLIVQIGSITFLLHKYPLLPRCGLIQRLCSDSDDINRIILDDIPGGEDAFELCAKFCYGIIISLGAHNLVPALCAAKFLEMNEAFEKGNLYSKLESFFHTCILEGWKDSIVALQTTLKLPDWSENLGIVRKCIDSIVEKILTNPSKVTWSYTYTRPGFTRKQSQPAPRDWWTEDISDLDIELFRCIITSLKSINMLPIQLIGEALHVFACRWLLDTRPKGESSSSRNEQSIEKNRRILENISSMIPLEKGSVSIGFLLKLLSITNYLGVCSMTKAQLIRRTSLQLEEATLNELLLLSYPNSNRKVFDVDLVLAVVESFLVIWKRKSPVGVEDSPFVTSIEKVGKLIDSYLQVISRDVDMNVSKVVSLAEALPEIAHPVHDDLYKAINIYLKEHPDLSKPEKKRLCRVLDCQKLSKEVRAHVVKNERLPLRTVVQVLFFEQEKSSSKSIGPTFSNEFKKMHLGNDDYGQGSKVVDSIVEEDEEEHRTIFRQSQIKPEKNMGRSEIKEIGGSEKTHRGSSCLNHNISKVREK